MGTVGRKVLKAVPEDAIRDIYHLRLPSLSQGSLGFEVSLPLLGPEEQGYRLEGQQGLGWIPASVSRVLQNCWPCTGQVQAVSSCILPFSKQMGLGGLVT